MMVWQIIWRKGKENSLKFLALGYIFPQREGGSMFEALDRFMINTIKIAIIVFLVACIFISMPNWWIASILVLFPTAYLLDKYWWRNTEMYRRKMDKLVEEMKNNRQI